MKINKKQASRYFLQIDEIEYEYYDAINTLEEELKEEFGEDIEFALVDGNVIGIGDLSSGVPKLLIKRGSK